ncbi:RNA polymerase sigma factor [Pseudoalteromonas sp. MMG012]|uniref:RNA polymerase sigma factor n=1 Tax=Pseudoalteromonas sp. MMG012 TaxID=2822686 RepID=UPI001B39D930|nr:sigma-70 family RNA polymerase sigma factor [Pseudoalteromonas sp. MMG012]MBQ4852883.1 sigma-70 family RNA polymerase sigma factor [Pseudoalteromonas sp. MMG012]
MTDMLTETELNTQVLRAQTGNVDAFTLLIKYSRNVVECIAIGIVRDIDAAKDVMQKVYIKVWSDINQLKEPSCFLSWVRQITRYTAMNSLRRNKVNVELDVESAAKLLAKLACDGADLEMTLQQAEQRQLIAHLVEQLPDESREITLLYYREEKSCEAVARLLDLEPTTVRKRLQRVREKIKSQILNDYGRVILANAPIELASLSAISISSTPVAASIGAAAAPTPWYSKLLMMLGGAGIGALAAMFAIWWSSRLVSNKLDKERDRQAVTQIRNHNFIAVGIGAGVMSLGYGFTQGWLIPVLGFMVIVGWLVWSTLHLNKITHKLCAGATKSQQRVQYIGGLLGLIFGAIGGGAGLYFGLENSGRLAYLM